MTRKLVPSFIVTLTLALPASAASNAIPLLYNDAGAASATNGASTLVAWTSMYSVYANTHAVYMRILDSPFDRNAIGVGRGHEPRVATNGRQYLIGYSYLLSRFNTSVSYDNALVQLVSPEGVKLGPPKTINRSIFGGLSSVQWNGSHWVVAYQSGQPTITHVAYLDESLNIVARLELGMGTLLALENLDGHWWAIYQNSLSVDAVELRADGTAGARFSTGPLPVTAYNMHLTRGAAPLLLMQDGDDVDAMPFDPFAGFGERRPFLQATQLIDVEPYETGSLVLVASSGSRYDTIFINAAGEIAPRLPLLEVPTQWASSTLGPSKNGLLLFTTPQITFPHATGDLFAYRVPPARATIDPASARLVSQGSLPDRRRSVRH
ncbi:MAG TPA: hypothetical protein VEK79_03725 [Thermoanaerobaculia bacterium]|nr:hypothetical protein [Thermoanaerobaculia bacterium]